MNGINFIHITIPYLGKISEYQFKTTAALYRQLIFFSLVKVVKEAFHHVDGVSNF